MATVQLLYPMGGLGTRFADTGISVPKPLIEVDGQPMIFKAVSSFEKLFEGYSDKDTGSSKTPHAKEIKKGKEAVTVRVIFVVQHEHEVTFGLRTKLQDFFEKRYNCCCYVYSETPEADPVQKRMLARRGTSVASPPIGKCIEGRGNLEVSFVMMHAATRGAAETCLLAKYAISPLDPIVVMDCDLYVYSSAYNKLLFTLAQRSIILKKMACQSSSSLIDEKEKNEPKTDMAAVSVDDELKDLRGILVFFNSKSPRYSYAAVENLNLKCAKDVLGPMAAAAMEASGQVAPNPEIIGGKVTRTAEKCPISSCSLIGAYGFAKGEYFIRAAEKLLEQPINLSTGLKEYYISLLYNFLLDPEFEVSSEVDDLPGKVKENHNSVYVIAVPREEYHSFGTPEELRNYVEGSTSSL
eukprot:Tbor_TRINITY_DN4935_c0_g1::TRINITY_DN4935_c0_g1_i1::g.9708::m.9708